MPQNRSPYRLILAVLGLFAVGAVIVGGIGLYTVLTGGTADGDPAVDVLGAYDCADGEFTGDPEIVHEPAYDIERTTLGGTEVESFDSERTEEGYRYAFVMAGELLDASASRPDGTPVTARALGNGSRVVVRSNTTGPVRVWLDTVTEDATVTRSRLDICPPT